MNDENNIEEVPEKKPEKPATDIRDYPKFLQAHVTIDDLHARAKSFHAQADEKRQEMNELRKKAENFPDSVRDSVAQLGREANRLDGEAKSSTDEAQRIQDVLKDAAKDWVNLGIWKLPEVIANAKVLLAAAKESLDATVNGGAYTQIAGLAENYDRIEKQIRGYKQVWKDYTGLDEVPKRPAEVSWEERKIRVDAA